MATEVQEKPLEPGLVFQEIGYTGLKTSGGLVVDDPLPQLRTLPERMKAYTEMVHDPVAGAVLFIVEQLVRSANWTVNPAPKGNSAKRDAEFLEANMHGMSHSWGDFITEAITMLPYGFSVAEICYREVNGKIMWKKLPFRGQDTIARWIFDKDGGIKGFEQNPNWEAGFRNPRPIPIEKALLFRTKSIKNNPEGVSVFRSSYRPYYFKKRIEVIEAIGIERDLAGYPVLYVPDELFLNTAEAKQKLKYAQDMVSYIRKDENMGAVLPGSWKTAGGLQLLSAEGSKTMDTERVIQRYDVRIAMALLGDIILMGHENAGSYAMADVKRNLLVFAMGQWLQRIADVVNRYAVRRLFALNGMDKPLDELPKVAPGPVQNMDPKTLADILFRLSGIDAFRSDPGVRKYLRHMLGFPQSDVDDAEMPPSVMEARARESIGRALGGRPDNETRPSPA